LLKYPIHKEKDLNAQRGIIPQLQYIANDRKIAENPKHNNEVQNPGSFFLANFFSQIAVQETSFIPSPKVRLHLVIG